ncbi:MAG: thioredoxin family protein [Planctomycetota bacterium]|nr:thioredoxin family protein [Planctomycetota bacterium]MDA1106533.1 thioredoxin family protein [Planctomycetota bacterium]
MPPRLASLLPRWCFALLAITSALGIPGLAGAQATDATEVVQARLAVPMTAVAPSDQVPVAVVLTIAPGWHIWPSEASLELVKERTGSFDGAIPTSVHWGPLPAGATVGSMQWPDVHYAKADIGDGPKDYPVYEGTAIAFLPLTLPADFAGTDATLTLSATLSFQACDATSCLPPTDLELTLTVPIGKGGEPSPEEPLFADFDPASLANPQASSASDVDADLEFNFFGAQFSVGTTGVSFLGLLLVAALGGFLLNLTPCVLPVIPLKVMGLAQSASNRRHALFLAAVMSAGVVAFWLALATLLASVQDFKQANQLFQYPAFTIGVGVFIAVMAIGMAGFFSIGLPSWIHSIETKNETAVGAFVFGILTAILSTPCTAPLMGAAAGWAVKTESASTIYAVFGSIGAGMAAPYLLLSAFPQLVSRVPRAGQSSEVVKQVMGILLLAAAAYFIGAGINQLLPRPSHLYWWVVASIGAFAGVWLVVRTLRIAKSRRHRFLFTTVGVAIGVISITGGAWLAKGDRINWVSYTHDAAERALHRGDVVVIDFTADWCINCKTLEKVVLETDLVSGLLNSDGVMPLKADIGRDDQAKERLRDEGFVTIPLLVVIAPNGEVEMKATDYTPQQVADAIERALASASVVATP